jgi:hypothetical protein
MSPTRNCGWRPGAGGGAVTGAFHQLGRKVDRQHIRAARGGQRGQRACAAARIQQAQARHVLRQPGEQGSRTWSRPARTVARIPLTGASLVSRVQVAEAVRSK